MYRTYLAWRYLRARRTNIIGIIGILVGVGALILILSIMSGFLEESRRTLRGNLSDIIIEPSVVQIPGEKPLPADPTALLAAVRKDPRVQSACAQITWYGILTRSGDDAALTTLRLTDSESAKLSGVRLIGIDLSDELATTGLRESLEKTSRISTQRVADVERPFDPPPDYHPRGRKLRSAVVGKQLAEVWHLARGDEINIFSAVPDPESGDVAALNRRYVVAGTFRSGENETDLGTVYLEREELQSFLSTPRQYTQVLVKLADYPKDGTRVRDALTHELFDAGFIRSDEPAGEVRTWEDYRRTFIGAVENEKVLMAIMLSLVLVVAGFTIFAILSMMVTEKRRDIGILCALGATPDGILALFLWIGLFDALIGAALGALIGTWLAIQIDPIERWLSSTLGIEIFNRQVYYFDHIPSVVDPLAVALIVLGAFTCTLVFAMMPAWKAGRMHPLDALRYE